MLWSTPEVKQLNKEKIRKEIQNCEECTKAEIARKTELSIVTCNTLLNEMLKDEEIVYAAEEEIRSGRPGRPASQYVYNKDYMHVLGIYVDDILDYYKIEYVVANSLGEELKREEILKDEITYDMVEAVIEKVLEEDSMIKRVAFGIPGIVDNDIVEECDVETLNGVNIRQNIRDKFGLETNVRNDMEFISYGINNNMELESGNLATLFFTREEGTYVGAGLVIDGKVLHGASHYAGQLSCIAEAFGISKKKQNNMIHDREQFCDLVFKMVMIVIGTMNPEKIVLMGNDIEKADIFKVLDSCSKIISEKNIPDLIVDNNIEQNYLDGLTSFALNKLQFPILMRL